jgi:hypothetical protein
MGLVHECHCDRMHIMILIGDNKHILKIQSAVLYKEEGEMHCM